MKIVLVLPLTIAVVNALVETQDIQLTVILIVMVTVLAQHFQMIVMSAQKVTLDIQLTVMMLAVDVLKMQPKIITQISMKMALVVHQKA